MLLLSIALSVATAAVPEKAPEKRPVVPFEVIFQELRREGEWLQVDGRWAWKPRGVKSDWRPFGQGAWVVTEFGWYWLSEQPWGWATSHYGRWEWNRGDWIWRPGGEWSPAWVAWRESPEAIAWHPLPPRAEKHLESGLAGSADEGFRLEGWTVLQWKDAEKGLLPRPVASTPEGKRLILEAVNLSSTTLTAATPEFLAKMRDATRIVREEDAVLNRGPDPSLVETVLERHPSPCVTMATKMRREFLVVWKDRPILTAYRPVISETPQEIEAFLARRDERYRKYRRKAAPAKAAPDE